MFYLFDLAAIFWVESHVVVPRLVVERAEAAEALTRLPLGAHAAFADDLFAILLVALENLVLEAVFLEVGVARHTRVVRVCFFDGVLRSHTALY